MLSVNVDVAAAKFNEMKLRREHAYIVVRIESDDTNWPYNCFVKQQVKKDEFPNEKHRLIKSQINHIVSYLWRQSSNDTNQNNDINTNMYSSIILDYFQFAGEHRNYIKELTGYITSNHVDRCCWIILDWNNKFCMIAWSPDIAKGKDKMVHASCKELFESKLEGIHRKCGATDKCELSEDVIYCLLGGNSTDRQYATH